MRYVGSKRLFAKHLLPVILAHRKPGQLYVEPFMGGCNMLDKVPAHQGPRWGNDINPYVVALFRAVQRGWSPPGVIDKQTFKMIKLDPGLFAPEVVAFAHTHCTFGGDWNGGYVSGEKAGRDFVAEGDRKMKKQLSKLADVLFWNMQYWQLPIPPRSLIYCDPPYRGTLGYATSFNSDDFWDWVRLMSDCGQTVFVSEYDAPLDFGAVVEVEHRTTMNKQRENKNQNRPRVERLFVYMG